MSGSTAFGKSRNTGLPTANGLKPPSLVQKHAPQAVASSSHVTLFLTNLRLLDLDLYDDWPGITAATFSPKAEQQNLKRRIHCVEWALYRLFEIWDADEAREVSSTTQASRISSD
jgi:hypothetical protein